MMAFGAKIKLSVNTSGASAFRSEIQKYVNTATSNNPIKLKNFSVSMTKAQQQQIVRDIQAYLSNENTLTLKIGKIDASGAIKQLRQQLQTMLSGLSITGLKEFLGETNIDKITQDIDKAKKSTSQWAAQMQVVDDIQKKLGSTYKSALSGSQMVVDSNKVAEITAAYTIWQAKVEELRTTKVALSNEEIQSLQQEGIALQQKISLIQEEQIAMINAANEAERAAAKKEATERKEAAQAEINARRQIALAQQQVSLKQQVQRYILSNSKAYKVYGTELDGIMHRLTNESRLTDEELKAIRMRFYEIQGSARAAGMAGNTFFDTMKKGFAKFGGWSLITRSLMAVYRVFTNMITAVKDVDAAMTELRKVTDLSERSYKKFLNTAQQLSKEIGATLADTVNATADFARLGYSVADSTALAEAALVYKNVGDGIEDISVASESLISTIKAFEQFGESANNAMSIIDRFNEVGNNFAISSEGIGAALQRSASSLAAAGNNLNESIALITGMNAVVQDPEKVGTALKTISMYLRAAKTEAEEAGEATDGMANSVSELREELLTLTKGKVDIMIDETTFKSTYQIMKELSQVWGELTDIDAANILELIGGKRNANAVTSLLTNFEDAEEALQTAATASGSALKENDKYLDSIAGKLSVLQSKFETFSNDLIDSSSVKMIVDIGSALLTVLDLLTKIHALVPLLGVSIAFVMGQMNAQKMSSIVQQIMLQKAAIMQQKAVTDSLAVSIAGLNAQQKKIIMAELDRLVSSKALTETERSQLATTLRLTTAEGALTAANKGLATSFKSLMASIPVWGRIALGISLVLELVSVIGDAIGSIETSEEKLTRLNSEMQEIQSTVKSTTDEYRNLKTSADEIIPRFVELAKGVNEFGKNISLTDAEYEEFIKLNNQIAEMFPELDVGLDSNGNHILALSYSVDTLTESLESLIEAERIMANETIAGNMKDSLKNIKDADKAYDKEIKRIQGKKDAYTIASEKINKAYNEVSDEYKELYPDYWELELSNDMSSYSVEMQEAWGASDDTSSTKSWQKLLEKHTKVIGEDEVIDWQKVINSDEFKNQMLAVDRQLDAVEEKQEARWQKLSPIMGAWLQTTDEYAVSEENVQGLLSKIIGNVNYSDIGITNEKKLKQHITDNFIKPITEAKPEVQNAMVSMFDIKSAFESGNITVGEYGITDYILGDMQKYGINDGILNTLNETLGLADFKEQLEAVKSSVQGTDEEIQEFVNNLTYEDFNLVYSVVQKEGSMSIEELQEKIKQLRYDQAEMVEPLNMDEFIEGLGKTANAVDKLTSAMAKLKEGTLLSKGEMMDLIEKYPKLLEQANIFADGSVESQKNALNAILDMQEQEYDAQIDAKIAELKATETVLNNQLELEEQKADLIQGIKNFEVNGKIKQEVEFIDKLTELNDLQGQNYVTFKNGELQVNEEALNDQLQQEVDYGNQAVENIWQPYGESIVQSHTEGYSGALTATNNYTMSLWDRIKNFFSNIGSAVTNAWNDMWSGNWQGIDTYFSKAFTDGSTNVSGGVVSVNFGGTRTTINGQGVDEWISDQEKASTYRIAEIENIKKSIINAINNLENLKGLDLTTIYGTSGSGSKKDKKEVVEYIVDVERLNEALQNLADAEKEQAKLERDLANATSDEERLKIYKKLLGVYKRRQTALHELNNLRDTVIHSGISTLEELGFEIEYDDVNNRLFIKNLEHLNELTADSAGEYETLQEATNALRKDTEGLIDDIVELNEENQNASETWLDLAESTKEANRAIFDTRMSISEHYLREREVLGWENGDTEIKARQRILEWVSSDYYKSLFEDEKEWQEIYLDNLEAYNDAVMSAIDKAYDRYSDRIDKINKGIDNQIAREQGLLDIKTKQYDAINRLADAQHEADKAIADSRISKAYLDDYEYSLIYNEEDYEAISKTIDDIDSEITRLTKNFNKQIQNAYTNGQEYLIETITAEYERQVELKMQELSIVQAELEITKKQTELNNVLAERNIRQMVEKDGKLQWEWVADVDKVRAATEELADAEYNYKRAVDEQKQQVSLDIMQENIDDFTDEQGKNNKLVEELGENIDKVKTLIDDMKNPIGDLTTDIETFKNNGVAGFSDAVNEMIAKIYEFIGTSFEGSTQTAGAITFGTSSSRSSGSYSSLGNDWGETKQFKRSFGTYEGVKSNGVVSNVQSNGKAKSGLSVGTIVRTMGGDYIISNVKSDGSYESKKIDTNFDKLKGYAKGTISANKGLFKVDEDGNETYITNDGTFHSFKGGEPVFNSEQTRRLWELSKKINPDMLDEAFFNVYDNLGVKNVGYLPSMQSESTENNYSIGDIIIQNPANFDDFTRQLTNAIRRKTV